MAGLVAIDGKIARPVMTGRGRAALHLVSAFATREGLLELGGGWAKLGLAAGKFAGDTVVAIVHLPKP